jgi:hypothetical protein
LSLSFTVLSLAVLRAAIDAPRYLTDSAVINFGIASPRNWKRSSGWVGRLFPSYPECSLFTRTLSTRAKLDRHSSPKM